MINRIYVFLVALVVILFDQFTKYAITEKLLLGDRVTVINNFLSFYKTYNTGAAFNILQNNTYLLILFSLLATILISAYFIKNKQPVHYLNAMGWAFILGGTVGNLIDRVRFGHVIDFIRLDFINFPIFNVADLFINIGAFLILFYMLFKSVPVFYINK